MWSRMDDLIRSKGRVVSRITTPQLQGEYRSNNIVLMVAWTRRNIPAVATVTGVVCA